MPSCIPIDYSRAGSIELLGALVIAGIYEPLLAIPRKLGIPVIAGEILIGVILVMLTADSHVNFRALAKEISLA